MVDKTEILQASRRLGLMPSVVEKDYVLSWLLAGIATHPAFRKGWLFKGGTCLRKCFFADYRFSEDLDFTVTDQAHLNTKWLTEKMSAVARWVRGRTNIDLIADRIRFDVYTNLGGNKAIQRQPWIYPADFQRLSLHLRRFPRRP